MIIKILSIVIALFIYDLFYDFLESLRNKLINKKPIKKIDFKKPKFSFLKDDEFNEFNEIFGEDESEKR